jgi:hypothetical protein
MFHPDTQFLIDHWTDLSRRAATRAGIPARADLAPDALGLRLPRAFIAERPGDDAVLRLAGTWIEAFHGERLKDRSLLSLWAPASRPMVAAALTQALREGRPVVILAQAGETASQIEITVAPLRGPSGEADRVVGLYAPTATMTLAAQESRLLTARLSVGAGESTRASLSLAAVRGRRLA